MRSNSTIFSLFILLCIGNSVFSNNNGPPPPINDICTGAIDLGVLDCGFYADYDEDLEATPDPEATGNCIDNTGLGLWYTFTTPDPIPYNSILTASPWIDVEVFSTTSDCSALVYEGCGTGPYSFEPEAGMTYYYLSTGGFHMTLPFGGLSACDDPLISYNTCEEVIQISSYNDCAWSSDMVVCPNDHVIWFDFVAGNSGADVIISVEEFTESYGNSADEISISVFSDDCSSLLFGFDPAGFGYVCSAMAEGQSITLEDLPPGFHIKIAIGSGLNDAGHFDLIIETANEGVSNDLCDDAEEIFEGITANLSNVCSESDFFINDCPPQSEATVWYEYDPGSIPQDIEITLHSTGIESPAIVVKDECWGNLMASVCGDYVELFCIDYPIFIQIGSTLDDVGGFDLEIETTPSISSLEAVITGSPICSNSEAGIFISIPSGEIVNITVLISTASSGSITGMYNQSFLGVNSAMIKDTLINTSNLAEEAIYTITIESLADICPTDPIEFAVLVYPEFKITEITIDECAPHMLELDAFEIVEGGSVPFLGILWYWNTSELVSTTNILSIELVESGQITLRIIDFVGCREEVTIDVDMSIPIDPTFDFALSYCRTAQDSIIFPETSLEGIEGTWTPTSIDMEVYNEDDFYDIIFTPNEEYCSNPAIDSVQIYSGNVPDFDLPEILCSEEDLYVFPIEDQNGIMGNWDEPSLDLSNFEGVFTNTFSHSDQGCDASFDYEFTVEPKIVLSFGQPDSLCRLDDPIILNDMSDNGYEGSWDIPIIDPNNVSGNSFTSTWTPNSGQAFCLKDTSITVQIIDPKTPEFNLPIELCTLDPAFTFPTIDDNFISGTWSTSSIDPSGLTGSIESVFASAEYCVEMYTWEIQIVAPLVPEFSIDTSLCSLDPIFSLPLVSDNGIVGSWSIPTIDPSTVTGDQIEVILFQGEPSGPCVETVGIIIEVIEAQDAIFSLPDKICWTDENITLPTISDNEIDGIWTPSLIDVQANVGSMVSSTFIPLDGSCANEAEQMFEIISPYEVETIDTDPSGCEIEDGSILIDVIQGNGLEFSIDGGANWQSSTLFSALSSGGYTIFIRSSDLTSCEISIESFLNTNDGPIINDVLSYDISSCVETNGSIIVDAVGIDLEYSINGGNTWQTSNEFNDLPAGDYVIIISEPMTNCMEEVSASISDFPQTVIVDVNTQDLSDCNINDGQIVIIAEGEALEYSIDNGLTWSTQNIFNNLSDGEFVVVVQSSLGEDCSVTTSAEILTPDIPRIINLDAQNPSLCAPSSGILEIEAEGNNLEYSIDGGVTWQGSNIFLDLEAGLYHVIVRDSERINCFDEVSIEIMLEDESLPESTFDISPPTECESADGVVEVNNALIDIEYSIDGGVSWQNSNTFENLSSGTYLLIVRKVLLPECLIEQSLVIPNSECPCRDLSLDFIISNISCTEIDSARVELTSIEGMYNPDIDILWHNGETGNGIEGIEEGWQIVTIAYDDHCVWLDSVWVDFVEPIEYEWEIQDLDCPDSNNGIFEIVDITGGSGNYEYSIDGLNYQTESIFSELEEGVYEVYVRDDVDCVTEATIEMLSQDKIEIYLPDIETIFVGESVVLDPGINLKDIDSFSWNPKDGISNPNGLVITVSPTISTIYTLDIFYRECTESKEIFIAVKLEEEIYVGNVFSPNGDNNNDYVYIQGIPNSTIILNNFSVYDRWGNKVFDVPQPEFNNKADGWDGSYHDKLAMSGVYVYLINYKQYGESKIKVGTVTLLY